MLKHLKNFSDLSLADVEKHFRDGTDDEYVVRADQINSDDELELQKIIGKEYFTQLGYIATPDKISFSNLPKDNDVSIEKFSSDAIMRSKIAETFQEHFIDIWKDYVSEDLINKWRQIIEDRVLFDHSLSISYQNKTVGVISYYPAKDCLDRDLTQIARIWIDKDLPKNIRRAIRRSVVEFISQIDTNLIQAGIHVFNVASQSLFKSIGFELKCAHILKS